MANIIFSHGFGVGADARGLFTQIAASMPQFTPVMFDYNTVSEDGDVMVPAIAEQAIELESRVINESAGQDWLIAHSLGCVVAANSHLPRLKGIILLAPPEASSIRKFMYDMAGRKGAEIRSVGVSRIPRSDGTYTVVPKELVDALLLANPVAQYKEFAEKQELYIIRALQDTVLGPTDYSGITDAKIYELDGDHDFSEPNRMALIEKISEIVR